MKMKLVVAVVVLSAECVAYSQPPSTVVEPEPLKATTQSDTDPRVVDRAAMDPEFFELAVTDPELAAVVAVARLPLPLPDDPKILDLMRETYLYLPPPPSKDAVWLAGNPWKSVPSPVAAPKLQGHLGTQVRLSKPDDPLQQKAAALLQVQPAPEKRVAHFEKMWNRLRFSGWWLVVRDAKIIDGVTKIQLDAIPLAETTDGVPVTMTGSVKETYELKDEKLTLLKAEPSGLTSWIEF